MIFYNNALLLQVLLSFSFANGSHILCKAEPPLCCKTVCKLGNLLFISQSVKLIFVFNIQILGRASSTTGLKKIIPDGSCHVHIETTVRACNNTREQDLAFKMSAVGGVLLNLYFVKLLFQFTKVVIFIVIKITFKFKLPKLNILENNRLSSLSLRRVLCEDKK